MRVCLANLFLGQKSKAFTPQENAAIEYVNSLWASQEGQYAFKNGKDVILAKDMAALTHPPGIGDTKKYLCIEVVVCFVA